ncbi:CREB3 regulatory factor isoform X1 [Rissa tridactyla]|uniref:CREB3 regulatory factor isoform X1 n=2 Tax=Rissa tridactyla TaxID=75485 RepID=UPI0023BAFC5E|nr:CREB3 regulatory factor isoform X1 [Rissa tridactyla]XP_054072907.1 CREB3 regulatory factor isoform X1 [Rissa tridactyla]XP_054072908.1 CREB3 regulatory factor isoform X1 [Rissa tridactyla]XP_054072909.1 CREB3 regulatory factor isoform X1 [Rissa tridactyla]
MPQPSVSGMDPPFGDAFRSHVFSEQTLMSTDLLASSSDPDFMYELDREMDYQQSSRDNLLSMEDCKDLENLDSFTDILDKEAALTSKWEQWDTYCEDLTKYTKLTSCDIWGTKEVDYLGLDDFSSPYQDEEVISKTPTLAQLNSEDSQPVSDSLYPDLLFSVKQNPLNPLLPGKKIATRAAAPVCSSKNVQAEAPLSDCVQKASKPATQPASSTQIMVKTNVYNNEKVNIHVECKDYVKKAKVKINPLPQSRPVLSQTHADAAKENTCYCGAVAKRQERKGIESPHSHSTPPVLPFKETQELLLSPPQETPGLIVGESSLSASTSVSDSSQKKEEHNYSLFVTDSLGEQSAKGDPEEDEDDEDDIEDEDHDEGFGSEHELSENDDEEEDYEDDKDDDISDTFSEPAVTLSGSSEDPEFFSSACRNGALTTEIRTNLHLEGYENDSVEDLKEMTAICSRKRGKRRYFWEYSEQLTPSQQERMLRPSEWNRDTLPSNMYQKNGLHHGKYAAKKSRRTDVEDLTPNPRKLLQIGNELRKLNKVISDLTPVSELPLTARPRSRKEKNKLASRACRLKKKAQYEANKVKLWGLNTEYDNLLFVINSIKQEIVNRVQVPKDDRGVNMEQKLHVLIKDTLGLPVAGQTSEFVNQVLEKTAEGDPTGGLVGLRIPMSKV